MRDHWNAAAQPHHANHFFQAMALPLHVARRFLAQIFLKGILRIFRVSFFDQNTGEMRAASQASTARFHFFKRDGDPAPLERADQFPIRARRSSRCSFSHA